MADSTVQAAFASWRTQAWFPAMTLERLGRIGIWPTYAFPALLVAAVAWRMGKKSIVRVALVMVLASIVAGLIANASRATTGRARPRVPAQEQGFHGPSKGGWWVKAPARYQSFPSAHTAPFVAFFAVLFFAGTRGRWLFVAAAVAMGSARISVQAHHFSDIVVASALGFFVAWWAWHWAARRWPLPQECASPGEPGNA